MDETSPDRGADGAAARDRYAAKEERALAERVIRWCIERYYGTPDFHERDGA